MTGEKSKYEQWWDGEWEHMPLHTKHRIMCCDCGLVHEVKFRMKDGKVMMQLSRHPKATAAARKNKNKHKTLFVKENHFSEKKKTVKE